MIGNTWDNILCDVFNSSDFICMYNEIISLYDNKVIYPDKKNIFKALKLTDYKDVKVVILGQDPYHNGQADGLAFSSNDMKIPASLKNIFKELCADLNIDYPRNPDLTSWANNGVLLLNTALTVEKGKPDSHKKYNWGLLTDQIIRKLSERENPVVFILWGDKAKKKIELIDQSKNLVLTGTHPSPLSIYKGGFFGEKFFSKSNAYLKKENMQEVDYRL